MEEIIKLIPDLIDRFGAFQTIAIILALAVVVLIVKGRMNGDSPKEAVQNAVTPMTCAWGEIERSELREIRRKIDDIDERTVRIEDRTKR